MLTNPFSLRLAIAVNEIQVVGMEKILVGKESDKAQVIV